MVGSLNRMKTSSNNNNMASTSPTGTATNGTKLFIGGLSYETTDESLRQYFAKFGNIASAVVIRDQDTNRSRGFGFVTFTDPESAQNVLSNQSNQSHVVDGRRVESKLAVPRRKTDSFNDDLADITPPTPTMSQKTAVSIMNGNASNPVNNSLARATPTPSSTRSSPTLFSPNTTTTSTTATGQSGASVSPPPGSDIIANKIFVGGLRYATTHETLRKYFEEFGEVETAQVIFNRDTKKSRGFGFVVFRDPVSVQRVLDMQSDRPPMIEGKVVEIKTCIARQDTSGSNSGANSPRAVTQTPIVTRSDSYSSLTSATSAQRGTHSVSATPVRPGSVFSPLPPPPTMQPTAQPRDPWNNISSPVIFETGNEGLQLGPSSITDRRASFASSVRSASPFGPLSSSFAPSSAMDGHNGLLMDPPSIYPVSPSPFTSPTLAAARESPSMGFYNTGSRFQAFSAIQPQQQQQQQPIRPRNDSALSAGGYQGFASPSLAAQDPRQSAFTNMSDSGNHDVGLFGLNNFTLPKLDGMMISSNEQTQATFRRQIRDSPTPMIGMSMPAPPPTTSAPPAQLSSFRPLAAPVSMGSVPQSPARLVVAKSPLLDQSLGQGMYVSSPNRSIW